MRYFALATDYDGTLAHDGRIDRPTTEALERLKSSGRKLILVTGRELPDLQTVFPGLDLFDLIVAENGALLYSPGNREVQLLADPPPAEFVDALRKRGVSPLSVGHVIVATHVPHEVAVIQIIAELGLELHVIFNKGSVMVVPSGVNKATGLNAALEVLGLSPHNVVGVGDAENDHAFLRLCECGVAVANALPSLKQAADFVTPAARGAGVVELIAALLRDDLAAQAPQVDARHQLLIGHNDQHEERSFRPSGPFVLLAGPSGGGKSTFMTAFLERLAEREYQFAILDPEGDYSGLEDAVALGDPKHGTNLREILDLLSRADQNVVVNLVGVGLDDRPALLQNLLPELQSLRARTGRPHWILIDEAHHFLSPASDSSHLHLPAETGGMVLVTLMPDALSTSVLAAVDTLLIVGDEPDKTLANFCRATGRPVPELPDVKLEAGQLIVWPLSAGLPPERITSLAPRQERRRHTRKYAEGDLGPDRSFYFRGPRRSLNLKAHNLQTFLQLADGVDEETWLYHLRRGDYSKWFRDGIKDDELAEATGRVEERRLGAKQSRAGIRKLVERRYTAPA
jgi:hydroxymethylpyrimidine pyrophosphatase-like HAD family hydrolase/energy-coupling factor transporter ATP-binding protein EcfA2